ncbi:response regulator transcription factor [Gimesia chilikensis]|uniref:response regulator transcription factor n=1 Tax=Gimesia chilikensis TaxID=2605989 RepID=UPI00118C8334|nr:response regulator [Gimesia chilikensis]QDT87377.1 Response regulator protein TodT [Gimesia chilikensis]
MRKTLGPPTDYDPVVYIIDDEDSVRRSLEELINSMGVNSTSYESAEHFLKEIEEELTGCVLTDLRLMGCNGIELIKQLKTKNYELPVIVVSGYLDVSVAVSAINEGAFAVLEKPYSEQELWDHLFAAIKYDFDHREDSLWVQKTAEKFSALTDDEKSTMSLLIEGHSNKKVAHLLDISQRTVVTRRKSILEKIDVDNLIELAKILTVLELKQTQLKSDVIVISE